MRHLNKNRVTWRQMRMHTPCLCRCASINIASLLSLQGCWAIFCPCEPLGTRDQLCFIQHSRIQACCSINKPVTLSWTPFYRITTFFSEDSAAFAPPDGWPSSMFYFDQQRMLTPIKTLLQFVLVMAPTSLANCFAYFTLIWEISVQYKHAFKACWTCQIAQECWCFLWTDSKGGCGSSSESPGPFDEQHLT